MLILALDSAVTRCSATIVAADTVIVGFRQDLDRGHASVLPVMVRDCLHDAGLQAAELEIIAVTVGPGSFTGIRAGVALAQGISVFSLTGRNERCESVAPRKLLLRSAKRSLGATVAGQQLKQWPMSM